MPVNLGTIETFPNPSMDKPQALKILEESAEVYSAWENLCTDGHGAVMCRDNCQHFKFCSTVDRLADECADVITAVANLLAALDITDAQPVMQRCVQRNRQRGRI